MKDIIKRYEGNPIISNTRITGSRGIFNGGFTEYDGMIYGILRCDLANGEVEFSITQTELNALGLILCEIEVTDASSNVSVPGQFRFNLLPKLG